MSVDPIRAAQIYADVAKTSANAPRTENIETVFKPNFSEIVKTAVESAQASLKSGEAAAATAASGEASLVDVVTAVSAAEVSLETAIAVRNRMIEAYQEILRMPI